MCRVIVAGGRDFVGLIEHCEFLIKTLNDLGATEIVSGKCSGADRFGERAAKYLNIPIKPFPANWNKYGKSAGPIRNEEMAKYADACVLFPGGSGTLDMKTRAIAHDLKVIEYAKTS